MKSEPINIGPFGSEGDAEFMLLKQLLDDARIQYLVIGGAHMYYEGDHSSGVYLSLSLSKISELKELVVDLDNDRINQFLSNLG